MEDSRNPNALGLIPVEQLIDYDLVDRDALLVAMFRVSGEPLLGLSADDTIEAWNPAAERLYGYTAEEAVGLPFASLCSDNFGFEEKAVAARLKVGQVVTGETVHLTKDGVHLNVLLRAVPVSNNFGKVIGVAAAITDLTERKRTEDVLLGREQALSQFAKEKEILITEIHHRVKNNLQTVVSLLSLHAGHSEDPFVIEALSQAGGRVQAIAHLHESLYSSRNFGEIEFGEYLRHLTDELRTIHGRDGISLRVKSDDVVISMETAIPLGLITNELIINSLKHAFPTGRTGQILAAIEYVPDSVSHGELLDGALIRLRVEDDGIGLSPSLVPEESNTLGLRIVHLLGKQLQAQVEIQSFRGTQICLTFSPKPVS